MQIVGMKVNAYRRAIRLRTHTGVTLERCSFQPWHERIYHVKGHLLTGKDLVPQYVKHSVLSAEATSRASGLWARSWTRSCTNRVFRLGALVAQLPELL